MTGALMCGFMFGGGALMFVLTGDGGGLCCAIAAPWCYRLGWP